jgi:hypothetical protein
MALAFAFRADHQAVALLSPELYSSFDSGWRLLLCLFGAGGNGVTECRAAFPGALFFV